MGDYRKLEEWQAAHALTLEVYQVTGRFPRSEGFGVTSQLRRAASSIGVNIAEGCGRNSDRELARFLRVALGSANEVDYLLHLARDLGFLREERSQALTTEVSSIKKRLARLAAKLSDRPLR
jgi:four helix bundle protein